MKFPGVGDRIRQRLHTLGYWKDGHADVSRFCRDHGYLTQSMYGWINNTIPNYSNLLKLAKDLRTNPAWLLLGEGDDPPERSFRMKMEGAWVVPMIIKVCRDIWQVID